MISEKLVFGFDTPVPTAAFMEFIKAANPGGVILFERNVADLQNLRKLTDKIHSASPKSLIMIDEEGGIKSRLRREHGFPNPPDPRTAASTMTPDEVRDSYRIAGEALSKLGIDVDLAPVADVAPREHILGDRSFSKDAGICALNVAAAIEGLIEANVCPCAKHFPGLGSADIDPHIATATARDGEDFDSRHFVPFKAAIDACVPAIMTTHLVAKSLDPSGEIATYSKTMVDILREKLEFDGAIISDDLFMGGAGERLSDLVERTVRAIRAGHDMVLLCREIDEPWEFLRSVASGDKRVASGDRRGRSDDRA